MTIYTLFPWVLSATSAVMLWLMGNKFKAGPILGLANQVLWIVYVGLTRQWGLLPGVILYAAIHVRNMRRWRA